MSAQLIALVALVAAAVVAVLALRRKKAKPRVPDGVEDMPAVVRAVFGAAEKVLRSGLGDRLRAFFEGPAPLARDLEKRLLVLGPPGSGKTALLRQLSRDATFAPASAGTAVSALNLFRLDGALAVDVAGRVTADQDANGDAGEAFRGVLAELRRAFPERPLDGVLLTVSAAELLAPDARDKLEPAARKLRRRVDEALRRLDMRAPVYLLVTHCDRVPSFGSFARELGEARRQRVLGWSSPAAPFADDAEGGADWVEAALGSVGRALSEEQARRFAGDAPVADPGAYFVFPAALAKCGDALRRFVDPLFHDASSGPPPWLRGVYFAGAAEPLPSPSTRPPPLLGASMPPPPSGAPAPLLFVEELFAKKILAEANLARPSAVAERRRVRVIRGLQVAAAVIAVGWGLALTFALAGVESRAATVTPYLHALAGDLGQVATQGEEPAGRRAGEEARARAVELLDKLGDVGTSRLRSFAVPTSLGSRVDARLEDAVAVGHDRVVLEALRRALSAREALAPDPLPPEGALDLSATVPLEKTPEFLRADRWLARVAAFEADVDRYNDLVRVREGAPDDRRAQAVAELSESRLGHRLDRAFLANARHFAAALGHPATAPGLDLGALAPEVARAAEEVFAPVGRRLLEQTSDGAVRADLEALRKGFEAVEAGGPDYTADKLAALAQAIERAELDFARAGLSWVPGDAVPTPAELDRLLRAVEGSKLLGPDLAARLRAGDEGRLRKLQSTLKRAELPLSGPVLARKDGALTMKLAPPLLALKGPIEALLRQTYMTGAEESPEPLDLKDTRVTWDLEQLKAAAKAVQELESFGHDGGWKPFPERVRRSLTALAARRLRARTLSLVQRAARREVDGGGARVPESVLRADADNLALSGGPLREILAGLSRAQLDDARDMVRAAVRSQGARVLKSAQQALDAEALYRVHGGGFEWWSGEGTPAFGAFEVEGAAQLTEYLAEQRARAQALTKGAAEPVLALMQSPEVDAQTEPVVTTWEAIASALRDYEGKKAGNSVAALERLVQTELPALTLDSCLADLDKGAGRARSGDYFAERRRQIRELLRARCGSLAGEELREGYARLRREFLRSLGDRFPFARGTPAEDAPPEATRALLADAGELRRRYRRLLEHRAEGNAPQVVRFLDRLDRARTFLEPLFTHGAEPAGFEVAVELRANAARELRGNQIAEWAVHLGDENVTLGSAKAAAKWRVGDPARVELRWAKNSPDMPAAAQGAHAVSRGRLVAFEHRGPWALLRLLVAQESALRDEGTSRGSQLLLFEVRTIPDPGGGFVDRTGTDTGAARVFIRLGLSGAGKDRSLKYPDFPTASDAVAL